MDLPQRRRSAKREELFQIITENAADMIALVNVKGHRLYNSPAYHKVLGYTAAELARTPVFEQIHPEDRSKVLEASWLARATGIGQSLQISLAPQRRFLARSRVHRQHHPKLKKKLVIVNRDVTEKEKVEEKLAHDAPHDALTGLANRRLFLDRLDRFFQQARDEFPFCRLFCRHRSVQTLQRNLGSRARGSGADRDGPPARCIVARNRHRLPFRQPIH